jgi:hypothetical protein
MTSLRGLARTEFPKSVKAAAFRCLTWPFARTRDGYGWVGRGERNLKAHRYICTIVKGEPPTPQHHAAHSCGNGHLGCVNPRHLSWKTPSENSKEGHKHPRRVLTPAQVREVRRSAAPPHVIAKQLGVREGTIRKIRNGMNWRKIA